MYGFRYAPHQLHMDIFKSIYKYLDNIRNVSSWLQTEDTDYLEFPDHNFGVTSWLRTKNVLKICSANLLCWC